MYLGEARVKEWGRKTGKGKKPLQGTSVGTWGSTPLGSSKKACGAHLRVVPLEGGEAGVLTLSLPVITAKGCPGPSPAALAFLAGRWGDSPWLEGEGCLQGEASSEHGDGEGRGYSCWGTDSGSNAGPVVNTEQMSTQFFSNKLMTLSSFFLMGWKSPTFLE